MPCVDEVLPVVDSTSIDESVSSLDAHLLMLFVYSCSYTTKGEKQEANGDDTRYYPANVSKSRRNLPTIEFGSIDTTSSQHQQRRANITSPGVIHSSISVCYYDVGESDCAAAIQHILSIAADGTHTPAIQHRDIEMRKKKRESFDCCCTAITHQCRVKARSRQKTQVCSYLSFTYI